MGFCGKQSGISISSSHTHTVTQKYRTAQVPLPISRCDRVSLNDSAADEHLGSLSKKNTLIAWLDVLDCLLACTHATLHRSTLCQKNFTKHEGWNPAGYILLNKRTVKFPILFYSNDNLSKNDLKAQHSTMNWQVNSFEYPVISYHPNTQHMRIMISIKN